MKIHFCEIGGDTKGQVAGQGEEQPLDKGGDCQRRAERARLQSMGAAKSFAATIIDK